ncbi:hypothetical protein IA929_05090 [Listeria seeligeri]|uniref:hypothetical protein n=1 Tax=Listeria seeligeri TaxID=1640 RepID=UPI00188960BE|nr:hypothetical protein [Listeria seeligeri]MBF2599375.1 hypothetical protein [Listeria seeligeri]
MVTATEGKVKRIGFDGPTPKFIIIWKFMDKFSRKTLCYSNQELDEQLEAHARKYDGYMLIEC